MKRGRGWFPMVLFGAVALGAAVELFAEVSCRCIRYEIVETRVCMRQHAKGDCEEWKVVRERVCVESVCDGK
jgi:hypothetical protein